MASRASLHPNALGNAGTKDTSAIKERQISILAEKLGELSNRIAALDGQIRVASAHTEIMSKYGAQQAALCVWPLPSKGCKS